MKAIFRAMIVNLYCWNCLPYAVLSFCYRRFGLARP